MPSSRLFRLSVVRRAGSEASAVPSLVIVSSLPGILRTAEDFVRMPFGLQGNCFLVFTACRLAEWDSGRISGDRVGAGIRRQFPDDRARSHTATGPRNEGASNYS